MEKKNKVLLFMVVSMILGYLPWYNFSAVLTYISQEFQLTASDTGTILASFQVGYVLVVLATGRLADLSGVKKVVFWATFLTGVFSTAFIIFAKDFTSILVLRLLTGLSAGAIYAPGMALLSNWFSSGERGKAIGAYTGATTLAYGGGYFIAAPLAADYGWRVGILATSLPVFIAAFLLLFFVDEAPAENPQDALTGAVPTAGWESSQNLPVRRAPEGGYAGPALITTAYMGHMWELYAFWGWVGPFMVASASALGYSDAQAVSLGGQLAATIILLGAPAVLLLGMVADRWGRTRAIIIGATCSLAAEFVFGFLHGRSLVLIMAVGLWIGFWVVSDSGAYKAGLTDMVVPNIRATSLGIQSAIGYSMTIIAPWFFGRMLDLTNDGASPMTATNWGLPFAMLGAGAILAPIAALILRKLPQSQLMANGKK